MRPVDPVAQAARETRTKLIEYPMVWITGKSRETGVPEGIGFWLGGESEDIAVVDMFSGALLTRHFIGAGGLLEIGAIRHEAGLSIRPVSMKLSSINPAAELAIRGYEPRGAEVQIWKRSMSVETNRPIAVERAFKGYIDRVSIVRPAPGGEGVMELRMASTARLLTIASTAKKSDEAQKLRQGDRFRRYKSVTGTFDIPWGTKDARS